MAVHDKLYFYSKSRDALVGSGCNEYVTNPVAYEELNKIKNWRQILSNFYIAPFIYKGLKYNSVEHAFQSEKIRLVDDKKAYTFSTDSNSKLSFGSGLDARKKRKLVVLGPKTLIKWDSIKFDIMDKIVAARYTQDKESADILLKTNNAILLHGIPRGKPMRMYGHEKARKILKNIK